MGGAVCETLAESADPDARWADRRTRPRHPTGVSRITSFGEPLHALRLRLHGRELPFQPGVERYADDAVVHCATERQALTVRAALAERMEGVGLRLHPDKTKIVYCKDRKRRFDYPSTSFTFLGFTFRTRAAPTRDRKSAFAAFLPAMSKDAYKA